jgi:hypothetical protein
MASGSSPGPRRLRVSPPRRSYSLQLAARRAESSLRPARAFPPDPVDQIGDTHQATPMRRHYARVQRPSVRHELCQWRLTKRPHGPILAAKEAMRSDTACDSAPRHHSRGAARSLRHARTCPAVASTDARNQSSGARSSRSTKHQCCHRRVSPGVRSWLCASMRTQRSWESA